MNRVRNFAHNYKMLFLLIAMCVVMAIISPFFLQSTNLTSIMMQISIYGIISAGMTFAVIAGEFDLSVGALMALTTIIIAKLSPALTVPGAILVAFLVGAVVGLINGILITKMNMSSFIATLGMMVILNGLALVIQPEPLRLHNTIMLKIGIGKIGMIPYLFMIFIACIAIGTFVLKKTRFGMHVYATGGNMVMAQRAGISTTFYKIAVMVITSVAAVLGGILLIARLASASAVYGADTAMDAVANIVIGGTSLGGGRGGMLNTLIGVLIMGVITNSTTLLGINPFLQMVLSGSILILVVSVDSYTASRGQNKQR